MDIIFTIISFIFIGVIVGATFTIGFSLLIWCIFAGICMSLFFAVRQRWLRWRFLREHDDDAQRPEGTQIIEGVYTEITDK